MLPAPAPAVRIGNAWPKAKHPSNALPYNGLPAADVYVSTAKTKGVQHGETTNAKEAPSRKAPPERGACSDAHSCEQIGSSLQSDAAPLIESASASAPYSHVDALSARPSIDAPAPNPAYIVTRPATNEHTSIAPLRR